MPLKLRGEHAENLEENSGDDELGEELKKVAQKIENQEIIQNPSEQETKKDIEVLDEKIVEAIRDAENIDVLIDKLGEIKGIMGSKEFHPSERLIGYINGVVVAKENMATKSEIEEKLTKITNAKPFYLRDVVKGLLKKVSEKEISLKELPDDEKEIVGEKNLRDAIKNANSVKELIKVFERTRGIQTSGEFMLSAIVIENINAAIVGGKRKWEDLQYGLTTNLGLRDKVKDFVFNNPDDSAIFDSVAGWR